MSRAALGVVGVLGLLLGSCSGPPASDAALCRDVITRLCTAPICPEVTAQIPIVADCATELTTRTGCATEAFMFTAPLDRATFLQCRLPIIRNGDNVTDLPDCDDVADAFTECPLMVAFFGGLSVMRRVLCLALTFLLAGSSSCASLMEETVHDERGPLLRTFDRPRIVEGGIKGELSVQWPKLTLTLHGFDTCRTEKVEEYAEEKIHERHGVGAGGPLSVGVVTAGAGALLLAFSGLFSANPNTTSIDENGDYGAPARDIARGWAVGLLCVGVPALAVAAIQLIRNGDEVEAMKVEQIASQHDETCHERAITGPLFLTAETGARSGPLPTTPEGILEVDAATVTAPIETFVFYEREVPLDDASERLLDGFNGCVALEHDHVASVEALTTGGLLKRLEAARACRMLRNDEASTAEETALKAEVARRRQGGEPVGYIAESFEDAVATHPPKLTLSAGSPDLSKLDDAAQLQGISVLLTGAVNGGLSPNIGVVRVGSRDVFIFLPPDAPWANDDFPPKTPVEIIGTLSGLQTVGDLTAPLVKALWMRKLSPPHQ